MAKEIAAEAYDALDSARTNLAIQAGALEAFEIILLEKLAYEAFSDFAAVVLDASVANLRESAEAIDAILKEAQGVA